MFQSCDWFYASESIIKSSGRKELQELSNQGPLTLIGGIFKPPI